jgi:hypothetical protein
MTKTWCLEWDHGTVLATGLMEAVHVEVERARACQYPSAHQRQKIEPARKVFVHGTVVSSGWPHSRDRNKP